MTRADLPERLEPITTTWYSREGRWPEYKSEERSTRSRKYFLYDVAMRGVNEEEGEEEGDDEEEEGEFLL